MTIRKLGLSFLMFLVVLVATSLPRASGAAAKKTAAPPCTLKGHKLYGKIKVVTAFPDLKVQIVGAFPDLKVRLVETLPGRCGEWQMVDAFPDLKIQFVDAFPDLKIKYVNAFPGQSK